MATFAETLNAVTPAIVKVRYSTSAWHEDTDALSTSPSVQMERANTLSTLFDDYLELSLVDPDRQSELNLEKNGFERIGPDAQGWTYFVLQDSSRTIAAFRWRSVERSCCDRVAAELAADKRKPKVGRKSKAEEAAKACHSITSFFGSAANKTPSKAGRNSKSPKTDHTASPDRVGDLFLDRVAARCAEVTASKPTKTCAKSKKASQAASAAAGASTVQAIFDPADEECEWLAEGLDALEAWLESVAPQESMDTEEGDEAAGAAESPVHSPELERLTAIAQRLRKRAEVSVLPLVGPAGLEYWDLHA